MLLGARHLVDRVRHRRSRADDLDALRRRLHRAGGAQSEPEEEALAIEMLALRRGLHAALSNVVSCSSCARGHPEPNGHWDGGHCCGTRTEAVFTDVEVRSLALAGTTPADLRAPTGDQAGCAFRGTRGCSLPPAHRPSLCVSYVCLELQGELASSSEGASIRSLKSRLDTARRRFLQIRERRALDDELRYLER